MTIKQNAYVKLLGICNVFIRNVLWQKRNQSLLMIVSFDSDLRMAEDLAQLIHSIPSRITDAEVNEGDLWFIENHVQSFLMESDNKHYMYEEVRLQIDEIKQLVEDWS